MKNITLYIAIYLIMGCNSNKPDIQNNNLITIEIDHKKNEPLLLSSIVDSISFIKLETKNNEIISSPTKVQLFKNKIYILDRERNSIFIFNKSGDYLQKIQNTGKGPGEYLQLVDFEINNQGIYLLDYPNNIIHYDFDFKYLQKIELKNSYSFSFSHFNGLFWISNEKGSEKENFHISAVNQHGETKATFIKKDFLKKEFHWHLGSEFNKHDSILYFSPLFDNRIYRTNGEEIQKAYTIDFGQYSFPHDQNIFKEDVYSPDFNFAFKQHFWVTDKYLILDFFIDGERNFSFFDKEKNKIHHGFIENDFFPEYRFLPSWNERNTLIEVVDAFTLNEYFPSLKNEIHCLHSLKSADNPILILYHLKT